MRKNLPQRVAIRGYQSTKTTVIFLVLEMIALNGETFASVLQVREIFNEIQYFHQQTKHYFCHWAEKHLINAVFQETRNEAVLTEF